jgi:hypothetical protein
MLYQVVQLRTQIITALASFRLPGVDALAVRGRADKALRSLSSLGHEGGDLSYLSEEITRGFARARFEALNQQVCSRLEQLRLGVNPTFHREEALKELSEIERDAVGWIPEASGQTAYLRWAVRTDFDAGQRLLQERARRLAA